MVRRGGFRVELVDAVTKEPFPEFEDEQRGKTFVQVTLNQEYFVLVESDWDAQVLCKIMVDGTSLGYDTKLSRQRPERGEPRRPSYCGAWCYKQGSSVDRALKFVRTTQTPRPQGERGSFWSGSIEVVFYEAIFDGYRARKDRIPGWTAEEEQEESTPSSGPASRRGVMVQKGLLSHSKAKNGVKRKYRKGDVLTIIDLTYSAADFASLGLATSTSGDGVPNATTSSADESDTVSPSNDDSNQAIASNDEPSSSPSSGSPGGGQPNNRATEEPTIGSTDADTPAPPLSARNRALDLLRRPLSWRPSRKSGGA